MNPDQSVAPIMVGVQQVYGATVDEVYNERFAISATRKEERHKVVHKNFFPFSLK